MGITEHIDKTHKHYWVLLEICEVDSWVSIRCPDCHGEIDAFEFVKGRRALFRKRTIDALTGHLDYCPAYAIFEEESDTEEEEDFEGDDW